MRCIHFPSELSRQSYRAILNSIVSFPDTQSIDWNVCNDSDSIDWPVNYSHFLMESLFRLFIVCFRYKWVQLVEKESSSACSE